MKTEDISMMVVSCDAYTDLGYIFFDLQNRFMGWFDAKKYFINENKKFEYGDVEVIHVGSGCQWSDKVKIALQYIETEYILFMLEDYFIGKDVDEDIFEDAVKTIKKHNLKYYRITPTPKIRGKSKIANYLTDIPCNVRYGVNLQAAIFRKEYLMEIVQEQGRDAWEVESDLNKTVDEDCNLPIPGCVADNRRIIDIYNGVIKGKWVPKTLSYFTNHGYIINVGERQIMGFRDSIRMIIIGSASHLFSARQTRIIKKIFRKLGVKFVTD